MNRKEQLIDVLHAELITMLSKLSLPTVNLMESYFDWARHISIALVNAHTEFATGINQSSFKVYVSTQVMSPILLEHLLSLMLAKHSYLHISKALVQQQSNQWESKVTTIMINKDLLLKPYTLYKGSLSRVTQYLKKLGVQGLSVSVSVSVSVSEPQNCNLWKLDLDRFALKPMSYLLKSLNTLGVAIPCFSVQDNKWILMTNSNTTRSEELISSLKEQVIGWYHNTTSKTLSTRSTASHVEYPYSSDYSVEEYSNAEAEYILQEVGLQLPRPTVKFCDVLYSRKSPSEYLPLSLHLLRSGDVIQVTPLLKNHILQQAESAGIRVQEVETTHLISSEIHFEVYEVKFYPTLIIRIHRVEHPSMLKTILTSPEQLAEPAKERQNE